MKQAHRRELYTLMTLTVHYNITHWGTNLTNQTYEEIGKTMEPFDPDCTVLYIYIQYTHWISSSLTIIITAKKKNDETF